MKKILMMLTLFFLVALSALELDEYLVQIRVLSEESKFDQALELVAEADSLYPDQAGIYAEWGMIYGRKAGSTDNFLEAGNFSAKAFALLDHAVLLDQDHVNARINRAVLGLNVPEFMGKLDQAAADLEHVLSIDPSPDKETMAFVFFQLGSAYERKQEYEKALSFFQKLIESENRTGLADEAGERIEKLRELIESRNTGQREETGSGTDMKAVNELMTEGKYLEAAALLREMIVLEPDNLEAHILLVESLGRTAEKGYDAEIYKDPEYMANIAFEIIEIMENAVSIDPDNTEVLLLKLEIEIELPFFAGKLDECIDKLEYMLDEEPLHQARIRYLLGKAYHKLGTSHWAEAVSNFSDPSVKEMVLAAMQPSVQLIDDDELARPQIIVDLVLGIQDELPPQTAVWIEDESGGFVKTLYVSGFSAYVKEKQVQLPDWAKSSRFIDAEVMTGASIDIGHHVLTWDLSDHQGNRIRETDYTLKAEICHWPHVVYDLLSIPLELGSDPFTEIYSGNELIPYVKVKYLR